MLFGGQSAEHDVCCVTAAHVLRAVDPARYDITPSASPATASLGDRRRRARRRWPPGPARCPTASTADRRVDLAPRRCSLAVAARDRTVVLPLLHGPLGEDGTVQGLLELADVPYVGSGVLGSALAMDKAMAKEVLGRQRHPPGRWLAPSASTSSTPACPTRLADELGLPLFVKPANMGSSVGVTQGARPSRTLRDAIDLRADLRRVGRRRGGDRRPRDRGRRARQRSSRGRRVPGEIVPGAEFYDYEDKYLDDGAQLLIPGPARRRPTRPTVQRAGRRRSSGRCAATAWPASTSSTRRAAAASSCNEVNTMPGFTPISMYPKLWSASGLPYAELIDELVRLAARAPRPPPPQHQALTGQAGVPAAAGLSPRRHRSPARTPTRSG